MLYLFTIHFYVKFIFSMKLLKVSLLNFVFSDFQQNLVLGIRPFGAVDILVFANFIRRVFLNQVMSFLLFT